MYYSIENLGPDINFFVSEKFTAIEFNDGQQWLNKDDDDDIHYNHMPLNAHYYQAFDPNYCKIGPQDHIIKYTIQTFHKMILVLVVIKKMKIAAAAVMIEVYNIYPPNEMLHMTACQLSFYLL